MARQKVLNLAPTMNRMLVQDQHDGTRNATEQVSEKGNDLIAGDRFAIGLEVQLDFVSSRTHTQGADQVHALIVLDAGAQGRRLAAWCPGAFERRDQRKPTLIRENQGCPPLLPLFLYAAKRNASNGQWLHLCDATRAVAVFGNSKPDGAKDTRRCLGDSAPETDPR